MAEEKSILEEAIIQMKNLEEAVAENAKGILGSVMTQEIKELVKESLNEADEEEEEIEDEMEDEMEDEDMEEVDTEDEDMEFDMEDDDMDELELDFDMEDEEMSEPEMESNDTIDLTNAPTSEVLKVFKLLSPDDEIVVTKDSAQNIHIKDSESDKEYMIVGEGEEEEMFEMEDMDEMYEMEDEDMEEEMDETIYEIEMDMEEEMDETIYEIEMDMEDEEEMEDDFMSESKKEFKAKGLGLGKPDFKYGKTMDFKMPKQKEGPKGVGLGKGPKKDVYQSESPSFKGEFKEGKYGMNKGDKSKTHKGEEDYTGKKGLKSKTHKGLDFEKVETKEAARTYGNGSKSGRGLRKAITPNRNLTFESVDNKEVQVLREKNEEYRKALNIFRNKLNEVAIFNSNLAYATRLFTEHSTSKQEKINILKRFDGVETLKESKNLYKTIKDELTGTKGNQITESIERQIEKAPATGSAVT